MSDTVAALRWDAEDRRTEAIGSTSSTGAANDSDPSHRVGLFHRNGDLVGAHANAQPPYRSLRTGSSAPAEVWWRN